MSSSSPVLFQTKMNANTATELQATNKGPLADLPEKENILNMKGVHALPTSKFQLKDFIAPKSKPKSRKEELPVDLQKKSRALSDGHPADLHPRPLVPSETPNKHASQPRSLRRKSKNNDKNTTKPKSPFADSHHEIEEDALKVVDSNNSESEVQSEDELENVPFSSFSSISYADINKLYDELEETAKGNAKKLRPPVSSSAQLHLLGVDNEVEVYNENNPYKTPTCKLNELPENYAKKEPFRRVDSEQIRLVESKKGSEGDKEKEKEKENTKGVKKTEASGKKKEKRQLANFLFKKKKSSYCLYWMVLESSEKMISCYDYSKKAVLLDTIDLTEIKFLESNVIRGSPGITIEQRDGKYIKIYTNSNQVRDKWIAGIHESIQGGVSSQSFLSQLLCGLQVAVRSEQKTATVLPIDYDRSVIHNVRRPGIPTVVLEEYAPSIFGDIRTHFGVKQSDLLAAWDLSPNLLKISNLEVEKNNEQFLLSNDKKYILKFIDSSEKKALLQSIQDYHQQVVANPIGLVMQVYGIYHYQSTSNNDAWFIMINNWSNGKAKNESSKKKRKSDVVIRREATSGGKGSEKTKRRKSDMPELPLKRVSSSAEKVNSTIKRSENLPARSAVVPKNVVETPKNSFKFLENPSKSSSKTPREEGDVGKVLYSTRVFYNIQSGDLGQTANFRQIFGTSLGDNGVPEFVTAAMNRILMNAKDENFNAFSVFPRDIGDVSCLDVNRSVVENGILSIDDLPDIKIVAGLLMTYFRDLPTPLVPKSLFGKMVETQAIEDPHWQITALHSIILQLDYSPLNVLTFMCDCLCTLGKVKKSKKEGYSSINALSHLCGCFGHLLLNPIKKRSRPSSTNKLPTSTATSRELLLEKGQTKTMNSDRNLKTIQSSRFSSNSRNSSSRENKRPEEKKSEKTTSNPKVGKVEKIKSPREIDNIEDGEDLMNRSQCATLLKVLIFHKNLFFKKELSDAKYSESINNQRVVSYANLSKLLDKLVDEYYEDSDFSAMILTCHDYFIEAEKFLEEMLKIFSTFPEENIKEWQIRKRNKVLLLIKEWLQLPSASDFWTDKFLDIVSNFINTSKFLQIEALLVASISRILVNLKNFDSEDVDDLPKALLKEKQQEVMESILVGEISTKQLALEISHLDSELFKKISAKECLHKAFQDKSKSRNYQASIQRSNIFDQWIQTCILQLKDLERRARVLIYFIELGQELVKMGNFQSSMSIYSALDSPNISRLELTWDEIPKRSLRQWENLKCIFDLNKNYKNYRQEISQHTNPIPYLGILSKDLFAIEEGNPNEVDKMINVTKIRLLFGQIKSIQHFQKIPSSPFPSKDKTILAYLNHLTFCSSEELYKMSIELEPKST